MLLEKGGEELLQEYMRQEAKNRQLWRDKKRKKEDDARKRMETNAAFATSAGEEPPRKKKKKRELQLHETAKVAGSSAIIQLKQANKEASVEAKKEKTAPVDTTVDVEEAEDKKPAAVQRVEPNEVKTAPVDTTENVEEAEDKKPAARQRATQPQKTKLKGKNSIFTASYSIGKKERQE